MYDYEADDAADHVSGFLRSVFGDDFFEPPRSVRIDSSISDAEFSHHWRSLGKLTELEFIDVGLKVAFDADDMAVLNSFPNLSFLALTGVSFENGAWRRMKPMPKVETALLWGSGLEDKDCAGLTDSFPNLIDLSVGDTDIGDDGVVHLLDLRQLKSLDISSTGISSQGLVSISRCHHLKSLSASNMRVRELVIDGAPSLETVCISFNGTISEHAGIVLKNLPALVETQFHMNVGSLRLENLPKLKRLSVSCRRIEVVGSVGLVDLQISVKADADSALREISKCHGIEVFRSGWLADASTEGLGFLVTLPALRVIEVPAWMVDELKWPDELKSKFAPVRMIKDSS